MNKNNTEDRYERFKEYFQNILRWPLLSYSYLAVIVYGLAGFLDEVKKDIISIRDEFIAPIAKNIAAHAQSRGMKRYRLDTDSQFKKRVINAYRFQKKAGKIKGLAEILNEYGFPGATIKNVADSEKWAEFEVLFSGYNLDIYRFIELLNEYKPARSVVAKVDTPAFFRSQRLNIGAVTIDDNIKSYIKKTTKNTPIYTVGLLSLSEKIDSFLENRLKISVTTSLGITVLSDSINSILFENNGKGSIEFAGYLAVEDSFYAIKKNQKNKRKEN